MSACEPARSLGWPRRVQAVGVAALLLALPLSLGGVPAGARCLLVVAVAALLLCECVPRAFRGIGCDRRDRAWLVPWGVVVALLTLQLVPLPTAILDHLGAYPEALRRLTDVPLSRLSPTPLETAAWGAIFTAYWAVAWMVSRFRRREVVRVAWVVAALLAFEAFYGLYALAHGHDTILGIWPRQHYAGDATGTYVNRNHFAGLLAASWPLSLSVFLLPRREGGASLPASVSLGLAILLSLLVGTAIFASHSRLGLLAAVAGLAAWGGLMRRSGADDLRGRSWLFWAVPALACAGALWFGMGELIERFQQLPQNRERFQVWTALTELPARTWILGAGAGSFADVFKTVQPATLHTSYAYAHNDWLELVVELGVGGALAIGAAAAFWWSRVRPARLSTLQKGALAGMVAIALHSFGDFNLRVPGTALAFWTLVGILAHDRLGRSRGSVGEEHRWRGPPSPSPSAP